MLPYHKLTKGGKQRRIREIKENVFAVLLIIAFIIAIGIVGASDYASGIR